MADNVHFVPPTLTLCQFCEFKCGLDSISFTTQSLPRPILENKNDECFRGDNSFPSFSVKYSTRRQSDLELCPADQLFPPAVSHIVSHETRNHRTYVSTPSPPQNDYSTIKNCLYRAANETAEANNILVLSSNLHQVKSSVIFRRFQIKDREARGETRKAWLMMVLSDRFAALEYVPYLQNMFGEIIRVLCDKSKTIYDTESQTVRQADGLRPLRSLSLLLHFNDLHTFLHQKFTRILYGLETKQLPLTIVPPGKVDELGRADQPRCFCQSPDPESAEQHVRDRAETLVEPPAPRFTDVTEITEMLRASDLKLILQNIVIGNQIVVRGQHPSTVESVLTILTSFLPHNCVTNFKYCTHYEPCYSCQFLGLPLNVDVPMSGQILVIDMMSVVERPREIQAFTFEVKRYPDLHKVMNPAPRIVEEIIELINLSKSHEAETYSTALKAVIQKWSSKSISYFLAVKTMIDAASNEVKLLSILGAGESDIPVLKFFKGALKHHEKNRLLNEVQ